MTPILAPPIKPHRAHPQYRGGTLANKGSLGGELLGHGRRRLIQHFLHVISNKTAYWKFSDDLLSG